VSERQTEGDALLPAAAPSENPDTTDYGVGAGDTVIVQAAETLGHYADWSGVSAQTLRTLNNLHKNAMVTRGHRVKLDFYKGRAPNNSRRRAANITSTCRKTILPLTASPAPRTIR
jgi:hypothetical protein